jgi:hypothetical protein
MIKYPEEKGALEGGGDRPKIRLQVWDGIMKRYPGWNPPVVVIFENGKRLVAQELSKVGWAKDCWGNIHWIRGGEDKLVFSVRVSHRHKLNESVYVYHYDLKLKRLVFQHEYIPKEALEKTVREWKEIREQIDKKKTGQ